MEKFAIITFPDSGDRIVRQSWLLERLPRRIVEIYTNMKGPRSVGTVMDKKSKVELGSIYNIPTLCYDGRDLVFQNRDRQLELLIKELKEKDIKVLSAPFIMDIFTKEEIEKLNRNGIEVLDPNIYHITTLYLCIPELLKVFSRQLPYMDVGVWRGDTDQGEVWVSMLAPYLNQMTIGGEDLDRLYGLSHRVLKETGLSCEVTTSVENCIGGKSLAVITDRIDDIGADNSICILSHPLGFDDLDRYKGEFLFYSGHLELPCEPVIDIHLNIWEYLTLSNSLLYILNGSYREHIHDNKSDIILLKDFISSMGSYTPRAKGVVNANEAITYDRFRMIYFKSHSGSKKVG